MEPLIIISDSTEQRGLVRFLWLVAILKKAPESQNCKAPGLHWPGVMGAGEKEGKKRGSEQKEKIKQSSKLKKTRQRQALEWSPWRQMSMETYSFLRRRRT